MKETFGPLGQYLDRYADHLHDRGFARNSVLSKTGKIRRFDRWLAEQSSLVNELTAEIIQRYFTTQLKNGRRPTKEDRVAVRQFVNFLKAEDISAIDMAPAVRLTRIEEIEQEYADYLLEERGLAAKSITEYCLFTARFLSRCFRSGEPEFSALEVNHIVGFVKEQAAVLGRQAAKLMTTALRSFLSYCRYQGYIQADLAAAVPTVAHWSAESLPKSLQRAEVKRVLSCCDRKTDIGMRDYAVLLLLARLGLRAGEISSLRLNDLDWQSGAYSGEFATRFR